MTIAVSSLPATRPLLCGIILLSVGVCPAQPQSNKSEKTIHIPSSGGEVLIASPAEKASAYDQYTIRRHVGWATHFISQGS